MIKINCKGYNFGEFDFGGIDYQYLIRDNRVMIIYKVLDNIMMELDSGRQGYVVCPLIEESESQV